DGRGEDEGPPPAPRGQPSAVGGRGAVDVEDRRAFLARDADEVAEDAGVEPPAAEVAHRNALLLQQPRRGLRRLEPAEGDGEARGIVAREPPREQPRDAVDARP